MRSESKRGDAILALDIGTSSVRGLVFDRRGHAVQGVETQIEYDFTSSSDGGAFVDAEMLFDLTAQCLDAVVEAAAARAIQITAVGISCFWHSLLGLDPEGKPTTPVLRALGRYPRRRRGAPAPSRPRSARDPRPDRLRAPLELLARQAPAGSHVPSPSRSGEPRGGAPFPIICFVASMGPISPRFRWPPVPECSPFARRSGTRR